MTYQITEDEFNAIDRATRLLQFVDTLCVAGPNGRRADVSIDQLQALVESTVEPIREVVDELLKNPLRWQVVPAARETQLGGPAANFAALQATFDYSSLMWLLRALREGPAVLDDGAMVAAIDRGMVEAQDFSPQWKEVHDFWRTTLNAHAAAKAAEKAKPKAKPGKLRRVA